MGVFLERSDKLDELENVSFEINFEVTEKEIEKVSDGLETVKKLTLEISKPMDKLLFSMAQGLQKIESSVSSLTDALTAATSAMQELVDQFVNIQLGNALQEEAAMVGEPFAEATGVI